MNTDAPAGSEWTEPHAPTDGERVRDDSIVQQIEMNMEG